MRVKVVAALLASIIAGACSSGAKEGAGAGNDSAVVGGEDASPDGGAGASSLPFAPSNVPASVLAGGAPGSMVFDGASCGGATATIDTDSGTTNCARVKPGQNFRYVVAAQADGSNVAVFVTQSLRIEGTVRLTVTGQLPIVIIALDTAQIVGELSAAPTNHEGVAGGFSARGNMAGNGYGPGAGTRTMPRGGGGGGSHCGIGGKGSAGNVGGPMYGAPTLVPLMGGSSGANDNLYEAGAGGGAIHIAAGTSIQISTTGIIHAGGAGGSHAGAGGGSGGAILLEAPTITVAGILAANGGAGGANEGSTYGGANSAPSGTPAVGGGDPTMMHALGGDGSAAQIVNGADGTLGMNDYFGGGGGGAGYIRLNTSAGAASITGTISPAVTTACATQGTLAL